jgi:hypothetical protein
MRRLARGRKPKLFCHSSELAAGALQHERQRTEDDRWTGLVDENHMLRSRGLYLLVRSRRTMSAVKTRAPVSSLLLLFRRRRLCATSILGPS